MSAQHPINDEILELLALGVLNIEESDELRAHLDACTKCAHRLAEARGRVALFAFAAPPQAPPAIAKERLFQRIHDESMPVAASVRLSRPIARWWKTIWLPAAGVLAIATVFLWINDRRMDDQLQKMREAEQIFENEMHHQRALVSILAAADTKTVSLAPSAKSAKWWADVKYNSRMGMVCYTGDLPAPPPHMEYQMWILPMVGAPVSAGPFLPAAFSGGHMCMSKMPEGISCKSFAVTIEPMGGMPHPTGPMVLTGTGL